MSRFRKIIKRTPKESAEHELRDHVLTDLANIDTCVAFRYGQPESSIYAFKMVWVPGHVFIAGDIGEITFTHHHALKWPANGLRWLGHSSADYLLSKSNVREEVDAEATLKTLRMWRDEPYGEGARARREKYQDLINQITSGDYGPAEIPRLIYESDLHLDDYYGSTDYPRQAYFQLACAQIAAKTWIAQNAPNYWENAVA